MTIVRSRTKAGNPVLMFAFDDASLHVMLRMATRLVAWVYAGPDGAEAGVGITWGHGRLIADGYGDGARRFFSRMTALGLSFGAIEAELREMTGYRDDPQC